MRTPGSIFKKMFAETVVDVSVIIFVKLFLQQRRRMFQRILVVSVVKPFL